ncbi:MAG: IS30 family transposase, partial [Methylophilaceae bacterium]|nr:IS30 family transposase [Methylophilaceae bacterium]
MARMVHPGLSSAQKAELWQRWKSEQSLSDIGRALGKHAGSVHGVLSANGGILPATRCRSSRSPSTVSREVSRNGGSTYRAVEADSMAWHQACRPKPCHLVKFPILQGIVARKLSINGSPVQIAGWLKQQYPEDGSMRISHETIY